MSESLTSAFNIKFCLYGTCIYVGLYIVAGSAGHLYHVPLLPTHAAPSHLLYHASMWCLLSLVSHFFLEIESARYVMNF